MKFSVHTNTCILNHVFHGLWWLVALVVKCVAHSVGLVGGLLHSWSSSVAVLSTEFACGLFHARTSVGDLSCGGSQLLWSRVSVSSTGICWWLAVLMTMCQLSVACMIKYSNCLCTEFVGGLLHPWSKCVSSLNRFHVWSNCVSSLNRFHSWSECLSSLNRIPWSKCVSSLNRIH